MERCICTMERKEYSAGAVKHSFWFMEFRNEVKLLSERRSFEEIKELCRAENIFASSTPERATQIFNTVSARIKALGDTFYPVFLFGDVSTQKIFNLAAIMANTLALLQTSEKQMGNHPGVIIFDEPTQHSIGAEDANAFFKSIIALGNKCQVIVGITVNNADIKNVISNLEPEMYKYIHIGEKAFV